MKNNVLNNTTTTTTTNNIQEENKMKLVMKNGDIKEVDTSTIFNNQYITTEGTRVYDVSVDHIENDIRLGEFYCCSKKQGTYEEVQQAIDEERSKVHKCSECWWFHERTRIEDECEKETIRVDNKEITRSKTVYEISCAYEDREKDCVHDIDEKPRLFREVADCFFCNYPNGVTSLKPLRKFMIDNAKKYGIVPYWGNDKLSENITITHKKLFGSYQFVSSHWNSEGYFILSNNRNKFKFYVDFENKKFILKDSIGYEVADKLTEPIWKGSGLPIDTPIKNYDKFAKWFWEIISDFLAEQNKKEVK